MVLDRVATLETSSARGYLKHTERKNGNGKGHPGRPATGPGSDKYQRILDAAVEVIAERGYFGSPVSAIAERAGVADGTIYLYFKSKDDVLRTAIDTAFDRYFQEIEEEFKTVVGPREQLEFIAQNPSGERCCEP